MTLTSAVLRGPGLITRSRSTGASQSATRLSELREEIRKHLLTSFAVSRTSEPALCELDEIREEAARAGWDGHDAKPVNFDAYLHARRFLEALPTTAPPPDVSADPDGEVSLDWVFGPRKALTLSIGANGRCSYAWVRGNRKSRGTEWLDDEVPTNILSALAQLVRDAQVR
ncbi:MAG TPA: hypothetical protein VMU05_04240 [Dongiaceae bacterium]|nr:hypothetical protein [Dongiaceae bacterium]